MAINSAILPVFSILSICNGADAHEQASYLVGSSDLCVPAAHISEELPAPPTPSSLHSGPGL